MLALTTPNLVPASRLRLPPPSLPPSHAPRGARLRRLPPPRVAMIASNEGSFDPELRSVLELATDEELFELEHILFGPSYFSPLLKSITNRPDVDYIVDGEDIEGREDFLEHLESRFLFLAADARSTLRGWRPTYRSVLLAVRRKLSIPCSSKLSTEDLEVEIFLHLLREYSSQDAGPFSLLRNNIKFSNDHGNLEVGISQWKMHTLAPLRVGAQELQQVILKGGGMLTLAKVYQLLARTLSGKMLLEAANYEIKSEIIKTGGRMAAINLESRAALLAARQGLARAASRYLGLRSIMVLVGPVSLTGVAFPIPEYASIHHILAHHLLIQGYGEHFSQMSSFRCLEQIMLEFFEQFMHLPRSALHERMGGLPTRTEERCRAM